MHAWHWLHRRAPSRLNMPLEGPTSLQPLLLLLLLPLVPCRTENKAANERLRALEAKLRSAEAKLSPLQQRIHLLEADKESAAQELAAVKEQQVGCWCGTGGAQYGCGLGIAGFLREGT